MAGAALVVGAGSRSGVGEMIHSKLPDMGQRMGEDGMLSPDAIADAYWHLHTQHRSAWTFELDLRPFKEIW